ncbi:MAG: hypothetical protein O3B24_09480 [Verrucomicrobia bacterium]|nr:hypothetical protein [Verrucomicrobiota bacterium]
MSITYKKLKKLNASADAPEGTVPAVQGGDSNASHASARATTGRPNAPPQKERGRRHPKAKTAAQPLANADQKLTAELEKLRIREQTLTDDAHNTTRLLEAAHLELDRMKKELAATRAAQQHATTPPTPTIAAELQSAREQHDRLRSDLALARADLAAERDARRQREDELVQNLRQAREQLEASSQTICRLQAEHAQQSHTVVATAATDTWFVRLDDDTVLGPVASLEARDWACQCRLGPDHELSLDRKTWQRARDVSMLQMEWMVTLVDDTPYGPLNLFAIPHLLAEGSIQTDSTIRSTRTGFTCSASDAGIPEIVALRDDHARMEKELRAAQAAPHVRYRQPATSPSVPRPPAPPKSVRAQVLNRLSAN